MPERSYKYVPGRGQIKTDHISREFGNPGKKWLTEHYLQYLEGHQKRHLDFNLRPSKYGGEIKAQTLLNKIVKDSRQDPFATSSMKEGGYDFGYSQDLPQPTRSGVSLPRLATKK
jgi:hypothetical protein